MKTKLSPIEKRFWKAIDNRDLKAFKKALAAGADVWKIRSADGENLLRCAMERRADDIALYLLESNQAVDPKDASLIWAVLVRRPEVVQRFIELGADVNARATIGTPLSIAAAPPRSMAAGSEEDLLKIMRLLLDAGADPNTGSATGSPLQNAVTNGATAAAELLIEAGARIGDVDELVQFAKNNEKTKLAKLIRGAARHPKRASSRRSKHSTAADPDVMKLESLCGTRALPLEGIKDAVSLHVDSRRKFNIEKIQPEFLKRGRFVFFLDHPGTRVVMLPAKDKFDALAAIGTSAPNFGLTNKDIVRWLRDLDATDRFILTGIGFDFLQGKFLKKVKNPKQLAKRIYDFCPDIFEQGVETIEAMARELRSGRDLFFWWD